MLQHRMPRQGVGTAAADDRQAGAELEYLGRDQFGQRRLSAVEGRHRGRRHVDRKRRCVRSRQALQVGSRLLKVGRLIQNPKGGRYLAADVAKRGRQAAAKTYRNFVKGPYRRYDRITGFYGMVDTANWAYRRAGGHTLLW